MKRDFNKSLGFVVHDVARLMRWNFDRSSQQLGLTRAQWSVLAHLQRVDGVQQKTLAQYMDIKPITLARHLDKLEAAGWVARRDDPADRRAKQVYLASAAEPMLASLRKLGQKLNRKALQGIGVEQEAELLRVLLQIRDNLSDVETRPARHSSNKFTSGQAFE
ncbi:MAG: MarR family winged helix-turn-helix transcriptional regulator [Pseudomonadales bacterium]|nr:MarR family winged helix-turn-helix transcriptional regulator [Pseudomonadales bacterium]